MKSFIYQISSSGRKHDPCRIPYCILLLPFTFTFTFTLALKRSLVLCKNSKKVMLKMNANANPMKSALSTLHGTELSGTNHLPLFIVL